VALDLELTVCAPVVLADGQKVSEVEMAAMTAEFALMHSKLKGEQLVLFSGSVVSAAQWFLT
jgi:hypothetical protein